VAIDKETSISITFRSLPIFILDARNSARSQMSERLLKHICQNVFEIFGAEIKSYINYVLRVCDNAKESHPDFPAQTKLIIRYYRK